jgi:3-hydroxymyristoyl/3-hydroxydecanoyl-(acyl carrier protein) dehydratase
VEHPAFEGHFPGAPLLPGVVLLDEMLRAVQADLPSGPHLSAQNCATHEAPGNGAHPEAGTLGCQWTIASAKFLQPVRPGETLTLEHEPLASGTVRFTIRSGGRAVASGTLVRRNPTADEPGHGRQTD